MQKLVIIILALTIMVFTMPNQDEGQPPMQDLEMPQSAATEQTEEVPEKSTEMDDVRETEKTMETNSEPVPTEIKVLAEEKPAVQVTPTKVEKMKESEPEETVKCVDKGDQSLAEYKPQIGSQSNPFENPQPTVIIDQSAEDIIGDGEDRPGEGKQF